MSKSWEKEQKIRKAEIAKFTKRLDAVEQELRELANLARIDSPLKLRMMPTQRDRLETAHFAIRKFRAGEPLR